MSVIFTVEDLTKAFDSRPLFQDLNFSVSENDRIGLIGPNGAGKSTLISILAGKLATDEGRLIPRRGLRVALVAQDPQFRASASIRETLIEERAHPEDWESQAKAEEVFWKLEFDKAGLDLDSAVNTLSGGWKKRVALARALAQDPDLVLFDEPTNHLDIEGILWLEDLMRTESFASITITHDRVFLERVSNRIIELDRRHEKGLLNVRGNYSEYLKVREALITNQENREAILRGILRRETEWLKAGVKARTTKQEARIQRHGELSKEVSDLARRNRVRDLDIDFQGSENNPKRLIEAKGLSKSFTDRGIIFEKFDLMLTPGARIGILGENGCGKSTLIRVLLGREKESSGKIFRSDQLKVCYFEQDRGTLDPKVSLLRTLCPFGDHINYRGKQTHIRTYLDRFLFAHDQADLPISKLSGGEQSRVLIAKLMLEECNLLVLDEPTNDLDMQTLNVLQDCLLEFEGAILLVSHDRYFLDQVSTEILAFTPRVLGESNGIIHRFADLSQWESWHKNLLQDAENLLKNRSQKSSSASQAASSKQVDAGQIMRKIERMEGDLGKLEIEALDPKVANNHVKLAEVGKKISELQTKISDLYREWESAE